MYLFLEGQAPLERTFIQDILKNYKPTKTIIFSRDRLKQSELSHALDNKCLRYFLGDVRDLDRLNTAMYGVYFVVHAAAPKQFSAAEYNPTESIKTNIYGADNIIMCPAEASIKNSHFIKLKGIKNFLKNDSIH